MKKTGAGAFFPGTFFAALLLRAALGGQPVFAFSFNDAAPAEELAANIVNAMTDEEALSQVFMFGWKDWERGPEPAITLWIKERALGGVKVFGRNTGNTERLAATIGEFQRLSARGRFNIPLLVATDQEGGMVRHVKGSTSETPGAMAVGASGYPQDAYLSGYYIGKELAALGINMNFAPSVDLFTNHDSTLIGTRSFGDDPVRAGLLAIAFAKGLEAAGIIATAKHFPGHGGTAFDSHITLPRINVDFNTLWERELVPFRMMARDNVPAIMSGHLAFPQTEAKETPASVSPWFLQAILREKIGFKGIIVTDGMEMNGILASAGPLSRAAKAALMAGNDIIMMLDTPAPDEPVWVNLLLDMGTDEKFRERVREAAHQVLLLKLRYLKGERAVPPIPSIERARRGVSEPEGTKFFQGLAARAATVVSDNRKTLPLDRVKAGRVLLVAGNVGETDDRRVQHFFKAGRLAYPESPRAWWNAMSTAAVLAMGREADTILFYCEKKEDIGMLNALRPLGKRVIVLSVANPAYLAEAPWVDAALAVYSGSYESIAAGFSALLGKFTPQGLVPFKTGR
ncbi:MAG: glycoside hydrolase family 3 protein [Spirochaetaceae bacterium]|jgi:beta-N-acetylhexosaminidase|nr:glycoside hydrolase family 3 protein [Spirochaetaceae bacterium]